MTIPATYLRYVVGEAGAGTNDFQAPGLTLSGAPYGGTLSTHRVLVNNAVRTDYTLETGNIVRFPTDLVAGDVVEIFRNTDVASSMVTFPTPTGMNPVYFNKAITQLLLGIQELHGKMSQVSLSLDAKVAELEEYIDDALNDMRTYVNSAIAGVFTISGIAGATVTLSVADGDTYLDTPYVFNHGILMLGGSMYNLSDPSHATLSVVNGFTRITFTNGAILGDHVAILIVLATAAGTEYNFAGLRATTYSSSWGAGNTTLLVPFVFDKGLLILGGLTYDFSEPSHGVTLTDVGGVSTLITLAVAPVADHEAIVVMFNAPEA